MEGSDPEQLSPTPWTLHRNLLQERLSNIAMSTIMVGPMWRCEQYFLTAYSTCLRLRPWLTWWMQVSLSRCRQNLRNPTAPISIHIPPTLAKECTDGYHSALGIPLAVTCIIGFCKHIKCEFPHSLVLYLPWHTREIPSRVQVGVHYWQPSELLNSLIIHHLLDILKRNVQPINMKLFII